MAIVIDVADGDRSGRVAHRAGQRGFEATLAIVEQDRHAVAFAVRADDIREPVAVEVGRGDRLRVCADIEIAIEADLPRAVAGQYRNAGANRVGGHDIEMSASAQIDEDHRAWAGPGRYVQGSGVTADAIASEEGDRVGQWPRQYDIHVTVAGNVANRDRTGPPRARARARRANDRRGEPTQAIAREDRHRAWQR